MHHKHGLSHSSFSGWHLIGKPQASIEAVLLLQTWIVARCAALPYEACWKEWVVVLRVQGYYKKSVKQGSARMISEEVLAIVTMVVVEPRLKVRQAIIFVLHVHAKSIAGNLKHISQPLRSVGCR